MTIDIYWRIGMGGDKESLRHPDKTRGDWDAVRPGSVAPGLRNGEPDGFTYLDHMADVARAAELAGFYGGLLPSFPMTDDPWATAAALARETRTWRFMIAFQPGFLNPVQAARMSASLQRATGGRTVFNVITGGGGPAQLWWGDKVAHDDRYARTSEFLDVLRGVWGTGPYDFDGRFYRVQGGGLPAPLAAQAFPEIYFSGSSPAAIDAAGRHADYYLSWLEPFDSLKRKFDAVREHSARIGTPPPKFAVRVDVLARGTEQAAWREIRRGWENVDPSAADGFLRGREGDSVGARRAGEFLNGTSLRDPAELTVSPGVWGGFSLLRPGPAFGLVGSYQHVAERLDELIALGVDAFILAATPHLEEAYRIGEEVLPLLRGPHELTVPGPVGTYAPASR